ncbi:MAG: T9SS C-terminal target domain-containing protein, partial [Cytophagales bacterium]
TYNTTNQCTATLSAFAPCADKVGWQHWKTVYNGLDYANNTIYWNNSVTFYFKDMPKDIILHVRLIYINGTTTTVGQSYSMGGGEYFKPILTAGFSIIPNGNCSVITTLTANSNFNNFQWFYPSNISPFGSLAGQPVSLSNNGTLPFYIFTTSSVNTQYKKTPWKVQSTNSCFTSSAFVTIPNWCEICSTVPLNLCSNAQRQESQTTETLPISSTKTIIYPNPTERILNIEAQDIIQKIVLFDVMGKEIAAYLPNDKKYVLDLQNINEGLYVVRIQTVLNTVETFKVQVNK